ncbi:NAD(P)H-dependent amine dehydrogenase family protein [Archaeoglobus veneficus]|uniref:Dihydrodipicolinate reductase n=1 Tax=Archaeoglobus veneficus (strain DSM 11195 / SNP6) TaxID=693661 RepID=F2KPW3_ARCVS|nr:dihydrodipicolinate reductase [Archaeoglobus veneficus]AEA46470.1 dihydrodipicolinate reductase [Archaeoglobus veneficus SNP6]
MVIKAVIYGFGQIGRIVTKAAYEKGIEIAGAVDVNPELVGKNAGELLNLDIKAEVRNSLDFEGDVVFLTTGSYLDSVFPQIKKCVEKGFNVISTCETLSYPEYRYPELAEKIDRLAKEHGVTVLGTGINPGFLLDTLLVVLSAPSVKVERIKAVRSVDALKRRTAFQKKVGVGMDVEEVKRRLESGEMTGHVGYAESVMVVCEAMGLKPDDIKEGQEIVVAESNAEVPAGKVRGLKGYASAIKNDEEKVRIEFHAYAGASEYEEIVIEGDNPVTWRSTGTKGDLGTAAILVNLAKAVVDYRPGLIKMSDLIPFRPSFV